MKKIYSLLLAGAMILCACQKEGPSVPPAPSRLPAEICQAFAEKYQGVFQLNEGQMGTNTATLDFLRFDNGHYSRNIFQASGRSYPLGDVGNDVAIIGNELWMVVNESGIVQVISTTDCSEIAAIDVPQPRFITYDDAYVYVSSYAKISPESPQGSVYRINRSTKKVVQSLAVGAYPEGIAYYNNKIYVAISGYGADNKVSVIKTDTFDDVENIEVGINPKIVISDGAGTIFVTTLGDYANNHSSLWAINASSKIASKEVDYVTAVSVLGQTVYGIGTENEYLWNEPKEYFAWSFTLLGGYKKLSSPTMTGMYLSDLCVLSVGDNYLWMVTDKGDCVNPGRLDFYWKGEKAWSTMTGICPGRFAAL